MKKILAVVLALLFAVSIFAAEPTTTKAGAKDTKTTSKVKKAKKHKKSKKAAATAPAAK